ncbi:hypothetical protein CTheo_4504 [Ceratobasidium theobromae]|uniref:Uncharacterized protein n=1 Tax=Ceratobasidium theobromae TaxID=1582974 RepID=A0A5N5QJX6_9AGAM|nr:hypothetical protein CTheo_4504 [Ceratobasidium theobromae]
MQHVFSLGTVFRASPFVNYNHTPMQPPSPSPPPPPPPQQKLLIKLRVSDLSKRDSTPDDVDDAPSSTKRRGGGTGTRGKRRKVDGDDEARRGRGKGTRGRGRGRKSGLQQVLAIPGTPDSVSSTSTSLAPTPTPISTPTIAVPVDTPDIDPALLATAPRRPLPTRAFPVQPAPKTTAVAAISTPDWSRRKTRSWAVQWREIKGVGGGSWWVRSWVGSNDSEYASDPARITSSLARPAKIRKSDSATRLAPTPATPKSKKEPLMGQFKEKQPEKQDDPMPVSIPALPPVPLPAPLRVATSSLRDVPRAWDDEPRYRGPSYQVESDVRHEARDDAHVRYDRPDSNTRYRPDPESFARHRDTESRYPDERDAERFHDDRYDDRFRDSDRYERESSERFTQPRDRDAYYDARYRRDYDYSGASTPASTSGPELDRRLPLELNHRLAISMEPNGQITLEPARRAWSLNGKGKGRAVSENGDTPPPSLPLPPAPAPAPAPAPEPPASSSSARVRSASGYEQAAKDVEMELMGE